MDKIYSCYVFLLLQTNFLQIYTILYNIYITRSICPPYL